MLVRRLDASGFARVKHWRVYAEEGLARCEVAIWLGHGEMVIEYAGQTLSHYDALLSSGAAKLEEMTNLGLFATGYRRSQPQLRLFGLEEALRLEGYAARARRRPEALQQAFFPYLEAL